MLISYDPMSDVLSITVHNNVATQSQTQGTVSVSLDATGAPVSVTIPNASSVLWENGGVVNVLLPQPTPTVMETVVERRVL
jgi:uncharacterized protein YuzE